MDDRCGGFRTGPRFRLRQHPGSCIRLTTRNEAGEGQVIEPVITICKDARYMGATIYEQNRNAGDALMGQRYSGLAGASLQACIIQGAVEAAFALAVSLGNRTGQCVMTRTDLQDVCWSFKNGRATKRAVGVLRTVCPSQPKHQGLSDTRT